MPEHLRPIVHHDHAFAGEAVRTPQIIVLVSADGAAFRYSILRAKAIDGPRLPVVLREDRRVGSLGKRERPVDRRHRGRHAQLVGQRRWTRQQP